jgi:hypothetical protein
MFCTPDARSKVSECFQLFMLIVRLFILYWFHIYDLHVLVILYWEIVITVGIAGRRDGEPLPPVSSLTPLEISADTVITGFNFIHILSHLIIQ